MYAKSIGFLDNYSFVNRSTGQWYVIGSETGGPPSDIPWGWKWGGMTTNHKLALGDYDGDGKTDRAIVYPAFGKWYIIGPIPFQIY